MVLLLGNSIRFGLARHIDSELVESMGGVSGWCPPRAHRCRVC